MICMNQRKKSRNCLCTSSRSQDCIRANRESPRNCQYTIQDNQAAVILPIVTLKVKVKSLSRVRLFATPRTVAYQAPPSMGFSRQEYWSGVPLPSLINPYNPLKESDFDKTNLSLSSITSSFPLTPDYKNPSFCTAPGSSFLSGNRILPNS